ncbi:hypothetical protein L0U88_11215 [Flavihumibacter sp. RY-1]|uniref:Glycosyl transferase family 28 C-terminal domain-containing protein n=1 Tax=Flavihumibacter fluminis TaxID=2909236 RepID=A0ABS9BIP2_9BACT|nr:glycosyltransferase [Flavihumibacter fluminis]MCF1715195.1 hypothetical protein [Flavihumibacter fluminis]
MEWGLGHASRCIPILNYLLNNCQADLVVAASGPQAALIRAVFPTLSIVDIPAYSINYHKNRAGTITRLAFSLPHLAQQIRAENRWLLEFARNHPLDAIISDNRYGLWHPKIPSFLITHQLGIKTPFGKSVDALVRKQLYRYIEKFNACWVPDFKEMGQSLAGDLSHPKHFPGIPVEYIGPLTRITSADKNAIIPDLANLSLPAFQSTITKTFFQFSSGKSQEGRGTAIQLLVVLSGPEPQRSIFEELILKQWAQAPGQSLLLVRGLPAEKTVTKLNTEQLIPIPNAMAVNHLSPAALSQAIANADCILTRSGYSSIMDLLPHHSNCCMVPTPGQTEQEYLAHYLAVKGLIQTQQQHRFSLSSILLPPSPGG